MTSTEPTGASPSSRAASHGAGRWGRFAPLTAAGTGVVLVAVSAVLLLHHRSLPDDFGAVPGGDGPAAAAAPASLPATAPPTTGPSTMASTVTPPTSSAPTSTASTTRPSTTTPPTTPSRPGATARTTRPSPTAPASKTTTTKTTSTRPSTPADLRDLPQQLVLPRFGIRADVLPVTSTDGTLAVPQNPQQVGWWTGSALPGSSSGTTVIDGHIDSATAGIGALIHLSDLAAGDRVSIVGSTGRTLDYTVVARRVYVKKTGLPSALFAAGGAERLLLISCGGPFDSARGSYEDNIVVFATPSAH